ncbi:MAG: hypothetical protein CMK82_11275 [Pseudomonadales bacterium]|uniref:hypothetical protein n=1 Tax=Sphingobium sp. TaxID=1912891 RepID=UPI000C5ACDEC|nr:hypothetical protein [Sphingobium sp.]MAS67361.1 hypothetical protein [Pseudomonadales bacterium]MBS90856.1 hypothetical protein [Sphingobium sp.]
MRLSEAMPRVRELQKKMGEAANLAERDSHRYQAHMTLYNVAVMANDAKQMEQERLTLHSALDGILDAGLTVGMCQREINEISLNVTDD